MADKKEHRGRIQAQGDGLEKSVSWSQDKPLTKSEGLKLLEKLKTKLTDKELKAREDEFKKAKRYIENVNGGVDAVKKKSFTNWKTEDIRVDIEILGGTAFVSFLFIVILAWLLYH